MKSLSLKINKIARQNELMHIYDKKVENKLRAENDLFKLKVRIHLRSFFRQILNKLFYKGK